MNEQELNVYEGLHQGAYQTVMENLKEWYVRPMSGILKNVSRDTEIKAMTALVALRRRFSRQGTDFCPYRDDELFFWLLCQIIDGAQLYGFHEGPDEDPPSERKKETVDCSTAERERYISQTPPDRQGGTGKPKLIDRALMKIARIKTEVTPVCPTCSHEGVWRDNEYRCDKCGRGPLEEYPYSSPQDSFRSILDLMEELLHRVKSGFSGDLDTLRSQVDRLQKVLEEFTKE